MQKSRTSRNVFILLHKTWPGLPTTRPGAKNRSGHGSWLNTLRSSFFKKNFKAYLRDGGFQINQQGFTQ